MELEQSEEMVRLLQIELGNREQLILEDLMLYIELRNTGRILKCLKVHLNNNKKKL